MLVIGRLLFLLLIFPVCLLLPGFLIFRRWRLPDELKLCVSVASSVLLIGAASFMLYVLHAPGGFYFALSLPLVLAAVVLRHELLALVRSPAAGCVLLHYAIFLGWLLLLSLTVRNYSGGGWIGDWVEHYQRALLFRDHLPVEMKFVGDWTLTARPPLNNILVAFFLQHLGGDFLWFQLTSVLLNSLVFLGAGALWYAVAREADGWRRGGLLTLTLLLCLNPSAIENATYPWTRGLTNFLVLLACALYLHALRSGAPALRRGAYLLLGGAALCHYSAGPYIAALLLVDLVLVVRRRLALGEALLQVALVCVVLAPWLIFALSQFGAGETFLTNSTVLDTAKLGFIDNLQKILGNIVTTWVPHPLRDVAPFYQQEWIVGTARDWAFLIYQVNPLFMVGSVGGLFVIGLWARYSVASFRNGRREEPLLLGLFVATVSILGIAVHGGADDFGLGHICLQPLALIGVVCLAAQFPDLPRLLRVGLVAGLVVDAVVGIGLHFWMQHYDLQGILALNPDHYVVSRYLVANAAYANEHGYLFAAALPSRAVAMLLLMVLLSLLIRRSFAQGADRPPPGARAKRGKHP